MRRDVNSLDLSFFLFLVTVVATGPLIGAQGSEPWSTLQTVRESLGEAGATRADFVQTYVPAGFSSGEKESGQLAIHLPDCLRWDYREPYAKSFLLCGEMAHYWNPEDGTGRRYRVDREKEPGLDLVLLGVEELRDRYRAASRELPGGRIEITLTSRRSDVELSEAVLVVDPKNRRLAGLSYKDTEGNLTRFEITGYGPLKSAGIFEPPSKIDWRQE